MSKKQSEADLLVWYPSTPVLVGGTIPAVVNQVNIMPGPSIMYQVSWWDGSTRQEQWVREHEVKPCPLEERTHIGYRQ